MASVLQNKTRVGQGRPNVRILLLALAFPLLAHAGATFPDGAGTTPRAQVGPPAPPPAPQREATAPGPGEPGAPRPAGSRTREELEADIQALELERTSLLAKYSPAHPDVRLLDRKLQARKQQLEALGPAPATKPAPQAAPK
jgi:hypothetical protein